MDPVRLIVYSDYLCPWCYVASHRLHQVQQELGSGLELAWRSYLLRPQAEPGRDLEKFMRYSQSWMRPASEPDAPVFRVWESTEGPPTHSVPAHLMAKAAARVSADAFGRMHDRLLKAYFEESRDISRGPVLRELWDELELPAGGLEVLADPDQERELVREVAEQHNEALEVSITGVPAVRVAGHDAFVMGAQPVETYRRWIGRLRDGVLDS